jgi:hypothetical protein
MVKFGKHQICRHYNHAVDERDMLGLASVRMYKSPEISRNLCVKLKSQTVFMKNKRNPLFRGRLHGAFSMCVSMSDKPFDAEACNIGGQASATNGLTDASNGLTDMKNVPCNRHLTI